MLINFKLETERINIKKAWIAKADKEITENPLVLS